MKTYRDPNDRDDSTISASGSGSWQDELGAVHSGSRRQPPPPAPQPQRQALDREFWRMRAELDEVKRRLASAQADAGGGGSSSSGTTSGATTVGSAAEGSEAAESTSWALTGGTPVEVWITSRVGFFEAGDHNLYGYARKLTFDSTGKLASISAETRYTIDVPET